MFSRVPLVGWVLAAMPALGQPLQLENLQSIAVESIRERTQKADLQLAKQGLLHSGELMERVVRYQDGSEFRQLRHWTGERMSLTIFHRVKPAARIVHQLGDGNWTFAKPLASRSLSADQKGRNVLKLRLLQELVEVAKLDALSVSTLTHCGAHEIPALTLLNRTQSRTWFFEEPTNGHAFGGHAEKGTLHSPRLFPIGDLLRPRLESPGRSMGIGRWACLDPGSPGEQHAEKAERPS